LKLRGNKMKFFLLMLCFILSIYSLNGCTKKSGEEKMINDVMKKVSQILKNRYSLELAGIKIAAPAPQKKIITLGLSFDVYRLISKDEARRILVDSTKELLNEINSKLTSYLEPETFTTHNLEISIVVFHPDGKSTFYPDIRIFSNRKGKLLFSTETPETQKKFGYHTRETETYEEALSIVQSQIKK